MNDAIEFTTKVTRQFDSPIILFAIVFFVGVMLLMFLTSLASYTSTSDEDDSSNGKFDKFMLVISLPFIVGIFATGYQFPNMKSSESIQTLISQENKTTMMHQSLKTEDLKNALRDKGYRLDKIDGRLVQTSPSRLSDPVVVLTPDGRSQLTVMSSDSSFLAQCVMEPKGPVENDELRFNLKCRTTPPQNSAGDKERETFLLSQAQQK